MYCQYFDSVRELFYMFVMYHYSMRALGYFLDAKLGTLRIHQHMYICMYYTSLSNVLLFMYINTNH